MWRSLVAHLTGGQGVAGSNPVNPTDKAPEGFSFRSFFVCRLVVFVLLAWMGKYGSRRQKHGWKHRRALSSLGWRGRGLYRTCKAVGFRLVCNYELRSKCWNMPDFVSDGWYIGYTRNRVLAVRNFSFGTEFPLTNQGIFRFL